MKRIKTKVSAFVFPLEIDSTTLKQKKKGTHNAIYCQEESKKYERKLKRETFKLVNQKKKGVLYGMCGHANGKLHLGALKRMEGRGFWVRP